MKTPRRIIQNRYVIFFVMCSLRSCHVLACGSRHVWSGTRCARVIGSLCSRQARLWLASGMVRYSLRSCHRFALLTSCARLWLASGMVRYSLRSRHVFALLTSGSPVARVRYGQVLACARVMCSLCSRQARLRLASGVVRYSLRSRHRFALLTSGSPVARVIFVRLITKLCLDYP